MHRGSQAIPTHPSTTTKPSPPTHPPIYPPRPPLKTHSFPLSLLPLCPSLQVSLVNENSGLSETVARMKAEHTILFQKRRRLEQQLEQYSKEVKTTEAAMARLYVELQRVNGLIAANSEMRNALQVCVLVVGGWVGLLGLYSDTDPPAGHTFFPLSPSLFLSLSLSIYIYIYIISMRAIPYDNYVSLLS